MRDGQEVSHDGGHCGWRLEFLLAGPATLDGWGTLLLLLLLALARTSGFEGGELMMV